MARRRRSSAPGWVVLLICLVLLCLAGAGTALQAVTLAPMDAGLRIATLVVIGVAGYLIVFGSPAQGLFSRTSGQGRPRPATTLEEFLTMTPTQFELAIGQVLNRHGYSLHHSGGPGDLAGDLTGTDPGGQRTVVQCKRYARGNLVGSSDVQKFIGMARVHHGAIAAIFVTTSDYTQAARNLAALHGIRLIGGSELVNRTR